MHFAEKNHYLLFKGVFLGIPQRRSRRESRELSAAASTSFSDENYVMILFSEYRTVNCFAVINMIMIVLCQT